MDAQIPSGLIQLEEMVLPHLVTESVTLMDSEVTLRTSACRADSTSSREGPPDMSTSGRECRAEEDWREGSCIGAEE